MLKVTKPVSRGSDLSWVLSDELFLNFNNTDWGARSGIDQNRAFLGLSYKIDASATLELGYLNQAVNTRTVDRENHVFSSTLSLKF